MVSTAGPLTLRLDAAPEDAFEPDSVAEAPLLRFEAFLTDARLFGLVRLSAARLTDLLNAHSTLRIHQARVESLRDESVRAVDALEVPRADLVAVLATGPRGDPALRRRTLAHPIAAQAGHFLIAGYAHAAPVEDPLGNLLERPPMIPLTDAWIEYWPDGERRRQWIGTVVLNRDLTDWIRVVTEADLEFGQLRPTG